MSSHKAWLAASIAVVATAVAGCTPARNDSGPPTRSATSAELDSLLRAAEAPLAPAAATTTAAVPAASEPAVAARPALQAPLRVEILTHVRTRDFAAATRRFEALAAADRAPKGDADFAQVLSAFAVPEPDLAPLLDEWVAAAPESFAPDLARAEHGFTVAFEARGGGRADTLTSAQIKGLRTHLEQAAADASAALARRDSLVHGYRLLIEVARTAGDQQSCSEIAARGLAASPASLRIRVALATCRLPRWGGIYEAVAAVADDAAPHVAANPSLASLRGMVDWDRGRSAAAAEGLPLLTDALTAGPHAYFFRDRSAARRRLNRYDEELADLERALLLMPGDPDLLARAARHYISMGRFDEAGQALRLLRTVNASHEDLGYLLRVCTSPACA